MTLSTRRRPWLMLAPMAAASAAGCAGWGAVRGARRRASHRSFDLALDAATAEVREQLRTTSARARRHDLINAFTAVEGAATILARDGLRPGDRSTLTEILESGIGRVRALLGSEVAPGPANFSLAEAAAAATKETPSSAAIGVDVGPDLVSLGSAAETAEAVRQLLAHADGRAPGSTLAVRGERAGQWAVLWVEDRGPQIPARERRAILDPDRRPPRAAQSVTPLHIAIRLTREQGGEVRVEDRPGGGASFGICLPAADS